MADVCDIMVDIETLGTRIGSVVLSAAFVRFEDEDAYVVNFDLDDQAKLGLEVDVNTLDWWDQNIEAKAATRINRLGLGEALRATIMQLERLSNGCEVRLWCHGAAFDAPMLEELYRRTGIPCPWSFRMVRDTRTLYDLAGVDPKQFSVLPAHVAANDAVAQVRAAREAMRRLKCIR